MHSTKVGKSTVLWGQFFNLKSPQIRTFHITWFAFFLCFFGWFGIAPLMKVVKEEFALTKEQIGNIIIASVSVTVFARLLVGWLSDKIGPRITYSVLLVLGSIPVMLIGLSNSYETFLIARLAIGVIGASFVITQYHTSVMFAPNVVGTANATSAGWGNLGGGVTQLVMPLLFGAILGFGLDQAVSWRYAMVIPSVALFIMGFVYYFFTQDYPEGNLSELKKNEQKSHDEAHTDKKAFWEAVKDYRVWALFLIYGACFGVELTIYNVAPLYFNYAFELDLKTAGLIVFMFGGMNIFARTLGGIFGDKYGIKNGLKGRVAFMGIILLMEGLALMLFTQMSILPFAIASLVLFSLFVQMSEGATYAVVPFINKKALGAVAGIVGAGGNVGAVSAGFLFRMYEPAQYNIPLMILGGAVVLLSSLALVVRFSESAETSARKEMEISLAQKEAKAEA